MLTHYFLPRNLHPGAWWIWALGLAVAASRTTNPWLLLLIIAVAVQVVLSRRTDAPWAMAFRMYVYLGLTIIAIRVFFRIVFGGAEGSTIILHLPEIPLPAWAAGIRLFGDVSAESVLGGLYDGLRLATMIICVGAANALANPKRLLKALPAALYEVGTTVIVAMSVFPQLAESVVRVQRARRLRGDAPKKRMNVLRSIIIPVLEDALDSSLKLASSMDSRGYGRAGKASARARFLTGTLMIAGLAGLLVGVYATLDGSAPRVLREPFLIGGIVLALAGFKAAGGRVHRTRYRPDRWHAAEFVTAASGFAVAAVMSATESIDPTNLNPSLIHLSWPQVSWLPMVGILIGLIPAFLTPAPPPPPEDVEPAEPEPASDSMAGAAS